MVNTISTNDAEQRERAVVRTRDEALEHLAAELDHSHNDNGYQFSILMVEFGGLSHVAHRLGDATFDDPLKMVAEVLTEDMGGQDLCFRLSSDDFLVICPGKGEPECRDLMDNLTRHWTPAVSTCEAEIDVSIGFASAPAQGSTTEDLLAAADEAMHATTTTGNDYPHSGAAIVTRTAVRENIRRDEWSSWRPNDYLRGGIDGGGASTSTSAV